MLGYSSLFVVQFCWGGGSVCLRAVLVYVPGGGWGSSTWCVTFTCLFCQIKQAGLEPVAVLAAATAMRNGYKFSQCNEAQGGFP
jgi:hypothetical protein